MRSFSVFAAALVIAWAAQTARADDTQVLYYANGWPIALVEQACEGDEGCLTQLANCPPGTDGTCTAQAGWCRFFDGTEVLDARLCMFATSGAGQNLSTDVKIQGMDRLWNISRNDHGIVQVNGETARVDTLGCYGFGAPERRLCLDPITDTDALAAFAKPVAE